MIHSAKRLPAGADVGRRRVLRAAAAGAMLVGLPGVAAALPHAQLERRLALLNLHTGESASITYWSEGDYHADALAELKHLLRDHRNDQEHPIDRELLDQLSALRHRLGSRKPFHVISGYRSPETNAMLRARSNGVAKRSLHMEGRAIDVRLPGVRLADLREAALELRRGGVGYYRNSNFVHLDTGRFRTW